MTKYKVEVVDLVEMYRTYTIESNSEKEALEIYRSGELEDEEEGSCRFNINSGDAYEPKIEKIEEYCCRMCGDKITEDYPIYQHISQTNCLQGWADENDVDVDCCDDHELLIECDEEECE